MPRSIHPLPKASILEQPSQRQELCIRPSRTLPLIKFWPWAFAGLGIAFWCFVSGKTVLLYLGLGIFTAALIVLILIWEQKTAPKISFRLSPRGVRFFHRRGTVAIEWDNIQRIDIVVQQQQGQWQEFPYIALKIKALNEVLDNIDLRLANAWLREQRGLLVATVIESDIEMDYEQQLSREFTELELAGKSYHGILGMFGHRSLCLQQHLGFHVYFATENLDRSPREFVSLLRGWHQQSLLGSSEV